MFQIGEDNQKCPINALTLREILKKIGFSQIGKYMFILRSKDILDSYPILLEDDGMGYGINEKYITADIDTSIYKNKYNKNVFNIFRDGDKQTN